jgi:NmrA-like family
MVLVAIAGGTSRTLGHSIVTAILEAGKHDPIILSRSKPDSEPGPSSKHGAPIRYVDYSSISSLTEGLHGVHTVISVLIAPDPSEMLAHHANLLQAAQNAGCKRFAPSEWECGPLCKPKVDGLEVKLDIWEKCQQSGLDCARFMPGWFMNYLGQGCPEEKREGAIAGLDDDFVIDYVDLAKAKMTVPLTESGKPAKITMTELGDIGRFVTAALDLEEGKWEADMGMVGSTVDFEEVARVAEKVTGRKFEVKRITKGELKQREDAFDEQLRKGFSLPAFLGRMLAQLMQCACEKQVGNQILDPVLNGLCPNVKPVGFEEYVERFWSVDEK